MYLLVFISSLFKLFTCLRKKKKKMLNFDFFKTLFKPKPETIQALDKLIDQKASVDQLLELDPDENRSIFLGDPQSYSNAKTYLIETD